MDNYFYYFLNLIIYKMKKLVARILEHLLENSTLYLTALLALGIALFEIWGNEGLKSKLKVLRSIIYILIFVLTILSIKKFNICTKCERNKLEKKTKKFLSECKTIEGTLAYTIEVKNNANNNYIKELKKSLNSLDSLILKIKESKVEDNK